MIMSGQHRASVGNLVPIKLPTDAGMHLHQKDGTRDFSHELIKNSADLLGILPIILGILRQPTYDPLFLVVDPMFNHSSMSS